MQLAAKEFIRAEALRTHRSLFTDNEFVCLDASWQNHVSAFDVDDAKESRVSTLRAWQVDYLELNFLWHFVRQQNFIFRWFNARTLLLERKEGQTMRLEIMNCQLEFESF